MDAPSPTTEDLVRRHATSFSGKPRETEESLQAVERALGVSLPVDLKWMLSRHGYGPGTVVSNITSSVADTLRFRKAVGLPNRYVVLDDRNDGGSVLLDTASEHGTVLWVATHDLDKVVAGHFEKTEDVFPTFASWLEYCLNEDG